MASANESTRDKESADEPASAVDALTPWILLALAVLAAAGAILRVAADRESRWADRLNETTLLYLAVGGALLLLKRIKTLSFGGYKVEMLEQIRARQVRTEDLLKNITTKLLPLLLPVPEQKHLLNLANKATTPYSGGGPVQAELRRLLAARLLEKQKDTNNHDMHINDLKDGARFDLAHYVKLTPLGEQWVESIRESDRPGPAPSGQPAVAPGG